MVRVRLTRVGSNKNPIGRVVVADQRSPRDGRVIETIGRYNPQTEPSEIVLDQERLRYWLDRGAQPTRTVKHLMKAGGESPAGAAAPEPAATGVAEPSEAGLGEAEPVAAAGPPDEA